MHRASCRLTALLLPLILLLCLPSVNAYDPGDMLGDISDYIPNELSEALPSDLEADVSAEGVIGLLDFGRVLNKVMAMLLSALKNMLGPFCAIMAAVVVSAVFSALKSGIASEGLSAAVSYAMTLCTALAVYRALERLWSSAFRQIETLSVLMDAMLPVMTTLYAAGGNVTSAAVSHAGLLTVMDLLEKVLSSGLLGVLRLCFVFTLVGTLGGADLGGAAEMVRNSFTTVLCFVMTLLSAVMAYQNKLAAAADSIGTRTLKFAAGNLIPVVGGAVGEAVRTLGASLDLIKSTVGTLGVIAVALIMLPTVAELLVGKSALTLISVISRALGCDGESRIVAGASSLLNMTLALVAATSVFFMFALTLFIKTAAAIGT